MRQLEQRGKKILSSNDTGFDNFLSTLFIIFILLQDWEYLNCFCWVHLEKCSIGFSVSLLRLLYVKNGHVI